MRRTIRFFVLILVAVTVGCANPYQAPCFLEHDCTRTPINR